MNVRYRQFCYRLLTSLIFLLCVSILSASAHPMGNFSINHFAELHCEQDHIVLHFVLDMAEIPTVTAKSEMSAGQEGVITTSDRRNYMLAKIQELCKGLNLTVDDKPAPLKPEQMSLELKPGAANLDTLRLTFSALVPLNLAATKEAIEPDGTAHHIFFADTNYPERTGWKEIVATAGSKIRIIDSTASLTDTTRGLTVYPADPSIAPPQQTEARFTLVSGNSPAYTLSSPGSNSTQSVKPTPSASRSSSTPRDPFTQIIASKHLTASVIAVGLIIAFMFGALHALSPGHGKTMVAAYLVGSRGDIRHAVLLGAIVTITHTLGVFLLGFATLAASRYFVPERLYPLLSLISGVLVAGIGLGMLVQRAIAHHKDRSDQYEMNEEYEDDFERLDMSLFNDSQQMEAEKSAGNVGVLNQPRDAGAPIPLKSLVILGITGGALPCPSALVVMLSAVALHRILFGLALITAFSIGLAVVLTGIGILAVKARYKLNKIPQLSVVGNVIPALSAAVIMTLGILLIVRTLTA